MDSVKYFCLCIYMVLGWTRKRGNGWSSRSGCWTGLLHAQATKDVGEILENYIRYGTISNPDILVLPMEDYRDGRLKAMSSSFFPELRAELGPSHSYKTKLIENIMVHHLIIGQHINLVLRPRRCGKSTMLQMQK